MEALIEILKISIPALIAVYGIYITLSSLLKKYVENELLKKKEKNQDKLFQMQFHAYERFCLFLERISIENLLLRNSKEDINVLDLRDFMIQQIRDEFQHNIAQQIYIETEIWDMVKKAKEDMIAIIYKIAEEIKMGNKTHGKELSKKLLYHHINNKEKETSQLAITLIKEKIQTFFLK